MLVGGGKGCQACQRLATEASQGNTQSSDSSCLVPLSQRWLRVLRRFRLTETLSLFPSSLLKVSGCLGGC